MRIPLLLLASSLLSSSQAFGMNRWAPLQPSTALQATTAPHQSTTNINGSTADECIKTADVLSLDSIRSTLIRQEETIIFALIERAQFRNNPIVYKKGAFGNLGAPLGSTITNDNNKDDDEDLSFLEYMLIGSEVLHCRARRYTSPEEHAFFPDRLPTGPMDALPQLDYPDLLTPWAKDVNFNHILLKKYIDKVVPAVSTPGDDEQHGSTVLCDIQVLQALSRRVHYGKFVAESKYRADPQAYQELVENDDADGVMELLTNTEVEIQVCRRARLKAATYGREPLMTSIPDLKEGDATSAVAAAAASAVVAAVGALEHSSSLDFQGKVDPSVIESVYRDFIIPLTKDVEVAYLFRRCGKEPPPEYAPDRMSIDAKKKQ